ncbi:MAG: hypothetical protein AABX04_01215 [Nanoarchaeota archaeon]
MNFKQEWEGLKAWQKGAIIGSFLFLLRGIFRIIFGENDSLILMTASIILSMILGAIIGLMVVLIFKKEKKPVYIGARIGFYFGLILMGIAIINFLLLNILSFGALAFSIPIVLYVILMGIFIAWIVNLVGNKIKNYLLNGLIVGFLVFLLSYFFPFTSFTYNFFIKYLLDLIKNLQFENYLRIILSIYVTCMGGVIGYRLSKNSKKK